MPLIKESDLDNPEKFVYGGHPIPLIDEHDDAQNGKVDKRTLELIAKNSNERSKQGKLTAITLGHTVLPGKDGVPPPEYEQPPTMGFIKGFYVANCPGSDTPCLWAHEYFNKRDAKYAMGSYPWRSVERLAPNPRNPNRESDDSGDDSGDESQHFVDRVALLRSPPRRDFGPVHYSRVDAQVDALHYNSEQDPSLEGRGLLRITYARSLPAYPASDRKGTSQSMFDHTNPDHVKALGEAMSPHISNAIRTHYADPEHAKALAEHIGPHLKPHIHAALNEMVDGPGTEPDAEQAMDEEFAPEEEPDVRAEYGDSEAGGYGGMVPGEVPADDEDTDERARVMEGELANTSHLSQFDDEDEMNGQDMHNKAVPGSPARDSMRRPSNIQQTTGHTPHGDAQRGKYSRNAQPPTRPTQPMKTTQTTLPDTNNGVTRTVYQSDMVKVNGSLTALQRRLDEQEQVIADQDALLGDMILEKRRLLYRQDLKRLRDEEGIDLPDDQIEEEINNVELDTPEEYTARRENEFRKFYRRNLKHQPMVPVGHHNPANDGKITSEIDMRRIAGYATRKGISFAQAAEEIRKGSV